MSRTRTILLGVRCITLIRIPVSRMSARAVAALLKKKNHNSSTWVLWAVLRVETV